MRRSKIDGKLPTGPIGDFPDQTCGAGRGGHQAREMSARGSTSPIASSWSRAFSTRASSRRSVAYGGIAHDFNNMFSVVIGNLDLLQRSIKDEQRR